MADKKLLFVINHMDWFWSHRLPLAKGAQESGWNVHVCAAGAQSDEKLEKSGFTGIDLALKPFKILMDLHRIIRREKPDMIHVITLKYAFLAGLVSRFYPDVKIVHTIAGLGYLFSSEGIRPKLLRIFIGPFLKFALKHPRAKIIFQNPDDLNLLLSQAFVREDQVFLIKGSGVNLNEFMPIQEPDSTLPIVLMPTRLVHDKGVGVFIEAVKILKNKGVDAKYQIAGGPVSNNPLGISSEEMNRMIEGSGIEWLGHITNMPMLFAASNLIVYPSYYREGVPKVLLEAAATGRAIITTDHAGCREAVIDGKSGILVPVKDAHATAEAMATLIQNATLRAAMGQAGRDFAVREFDVISVVTRTLAVYDKAMEG